MIYFLFGTKAQIIKSEFILYELFKKDIEINIINTNQHVEITKNILNNFNFPFKYLHLNNRTKNANSISGILLFFLKNLFIILFKNFDIEKNKYCILHGDTLSTFLGVVFCKKYNLKIIHVEAGYSSKKIFKPFPEELIRKIVSYFSDYLVCDGEVQLKNLKKYKNSKNIISIPQNTIVDSVISKIPNNANKKNILTITLHRTENIFKRNKIKEFVELINSLNLNFNFEKITWFVHETTKPKIIKIFGIDYFKNNNIEIAELVPHKKFVEIIYSSKAVLTDGGSIKQECSILNIPTIIWRDVDDDPAYSTDNIFLSKYSIENSIIFLEKVFHNRQKEVNINIESPSKELVNKIASKLI